MTERRRFLVWAGALPPAVVVSGCATGPRTGAKAVASKAPEIRTDTGPLTRRLPKLGRIVSAHWQQETPGGDSRVPGPTDYFVNALMKLGSGSVAALTASAQMEPAVAGPEPDGISIPAGLTEFVPGQARWVRSAALDERLVRADFAALYFDRASDTVYLSATNLLLPDTATAEAGPDGKQVTITPTP
ncbi:hypothetical protein [Streptomyces sp. NPDC058620]|uniref:hypothetical protein n=1 Tax=Streptomyces sp. NPDC058620 TaxID=3346560 RepID=UPI003646AF9A